MKISERDASLLLTEDGKAVLEAASVQLPESAFLEVQVEDGDDIGLWIRIEREDGDHLLLVRWEYVLSIDFEAGPTKVLGMR